MGVKYIEPEYLKPHYSTRFFRSHKIYLQNMHSPTLFSEICEELKVPEDYLLKDDNWVSNLFMSRYIDKLIKKTEDPDINHKIGSNFWDPNSISPLEATLQRMIPPYFFYLLSPLQISKVNLLVKYKLLVTRPGHFLYDVRHSESVHPEICKNTVGILEASKNLFNLDLIKVEHIQCVHKGAQSCLFDVRYRARKYWGKKILNIGLVAAIFVASYWYINISFPQDAVPKAIFLKLAISSTAFLMLLITLGARFYKILKFNKSYYVQNQRKNEELFEKNKKLDRRYQEANLLRSLSYKLLRHNNSKELISSSLTELERRFGYERSLVMLVDQSIEKLVTVDVRGFNEHTDMLFKLNFKYPAEKEHPQIFANILERGECTLINDMFEFKKNLEPQNQILLTAFGVKSLIVSPIQDAVSKYGILVIGSIGDDKQLSTDDKHLIENIAQMMALFFQNARNFERERTLKSLFQRYVPKVVIDGIRHLENGETGHLAPKNNAVSSIFIDLRDFTSISETLAPERVVEMLNIYIEHVTNVVAGEGGIIDNLVGDGVVAFFPAAEEDRVEHARKALTAGIKILSGLDNLNNKFIARGFPQARLGIGIHSGNATVGNLGSDKKMNYTAIGDTVNLASRLESLCKKYSNLSSTAQEGLLIFSDEVYKRARLKVPHLELGKIKVRGRSDDVLVYCIDKSTACSVDFSKIPTLTNEEVKAMSAPHLLIETPMPSRRRKDRKINRRAS